MNRYYLYVAAIIILLISTNCTRQKMGSGDNIVNSKSQSDKTIANIVEAVSRLSINESSASLLTITYPYNGTVFPSDISAPRLTWKDNNIESRQWLITVSFHNNNQPLHILTAQPYWMPDNNIWKNIKSNTMVEPAALAVTGITGEKQLKITSHDSITISTSVDKVEAPIFFRQVPLPFSTKNFDKMKWCLGDVTSHEKPKVVMEKLPICASCHTFSRDGKKLSMEMNMGGDSGAQFITPVKKDIILTLGDFMSWNDFPRSGILPKTRGLFGKMSPSARYIIASVNEISLALLTNNLSFSQVFFPTYGILAIYSVKERTITPLPGADDYRFVHANPNWSPDEKYIVFSRAKAKNEVHDDITHVVPIVKNEDIHNLNNRYNIQFDLYRIPFNNGKGGIAEPVVGASNNGFSNYFPRPSPDGKWIVYTRSRTGIMLQPDSQLYIVSSQGGIARKMKCNRTLFNSWHSWSPNGKWLLFSSKVNTPYTEIFLTHIDENGNDSPPVLLSHLSSKTHAANVPEFVNIEYNAINKIRVEGYDN